MRNIKRFKMDYHNFDEKDRASCVLVNNGIYSGVGSAFCHLDDEMSELIGGKIAHKRAIMDGYEWILKDFKAELKAFKDFYSNLEGHKNFDKNEYTARRLRKEIYTREAEIKELQQFIKGIEASIEADDKKREIIRAKYSNQDKKE